MFPSMMPSELLIQNSGDQSRLLERRPVTSNPVAPLPITLTSGFLARRTVPGTYVKTAINAAIEAVAKILANELAPIRVNVISPGLTDTAAYATMPENSRIEMLAKAKDSLPAGKAGTADEIAVGYLFAIDNPYVTGAEPANQATCQTT